MATRDLVTVLNDALEHDDNAQLDRNQLTNIKQNAEAGYYATKDPADLVADLKGAGASALAAQAELGDFNETQQDRRSAWLATQPEPPEGTGEVDDDDDDDDEETAPIAEAPAETPAEPPPPATTSAESFARNVPG